MPKVVQLGGAEEVYAKWLDCPRKIRNLTSPETLQMAFPRRFLSIKLELAKPNSLKIKALPRETSLICRARLQICRLTLPHPPSTSPVVLGLLKAFLNLQVLFVILMVKIQTLLYMCHCTRMILTFSISVTSRVGLPYK